MVSSTNKTDCHDITEILLKVALNIITLTHKATPANDSKILLYCPPQERPPLSYGHFFIAGAVAL
jgi:hypothetical protein